MAGLGCATWTIVLDEVSLIAVRGLTRELQKFNEQQRPTAVLTCTGKVDVKALREQWNGENPPPPPIEDRPDPPPRSCPRARPKPRPRLREETPPEPPPINEGTVV